MSRLSTRLARLPLHVRLVAGFSVTMLLVLTAAGAFVYWRVSYALDRQINDDLTEVTKTLAPYVTPSGRLSSDAPILAGDQTYQVMDRDGAVLSSSAGLDGNPLIGTEAVREALFAPVHRDIGALLPINKHPLRAYATALPGADNLKAAVLVVAVRRDHRDEALLELLGQLAAAGLGALVVTGLVGDRLARLALRPVERYRAQADDIVAGATGVRLDVPVERDDEVIRLGHTLNAMLEALESALERERRFVNDASHELRTPLTLLKTRLQLTLRRPRTIEQHEAVLAEIETDVIRLTRLAEQLLEVGIGQQDAAQDRCDLAEVTTQETGLRTAHDEVEGQEADFPMQVRAAGPVPVPLAATQVGRMVGNLLDNAWLHGHPPVIVTVDKDGDTGRLMVTDRGPGMDADTLATATHRFARSAESRSRAGFGLGLSLVEGIVTSANGELRLCFAGRHQSFGQLQPPLCEHGAEMTVTVLLPVLTEVEAHRARRP